jgi:hypothetical protein
MKKIVKLTESDLERIINKVIKEDKRKSLHEAVNINGITVDIDKNDPNKLTFAGCKYQVFASIAGMSVNPGRFQALNDKGNQIGVKFDNKDNNVNKSFLQQNIGKFKGCPGQVKLTYEIDWAPDVDLTFVKK